MAISPTSHNRTRPVAETISSNYVGNAPLQTNPTQGSTLVKRSRPNLPSKENSDLADQPITASSTNVRAYIPQEQGGNIPLKEINAPVKKGYSRASVFNLLIAGNQNNLDRQNRAILEQESKNVQNSVEKRQAGL